MKPLVLLTNDDGINSDGLHVFRSFLNKFFDVYIVAPLIERSTTSHTLSLHKPLHLSNIDEKTFAVDGFPADCAYMGIFKLLPRKPDLVISGINKGANIAQDVFYSGTIAAARQAVLNGISGIATSLRCAKNEAIHWEEASEYLASLIKNIYPKIEGKNKLLNINYPNVTNDKIKGVRFVPFGERVYKEEVVTKQDPRGNTYHWIGGDYSHIINIPNTDCTVVEDNYVSITPVAMNATDYEALNTMQDWLGKPNEIWS